MSRKVFFMAVSRFFTLQYFRVFVALVICLFSCFMGIFHSSHHQSSTFIARACSSAETTMHLVSESTFYHPHDFTVRGWSS
jgi:hypothetical protein